jgi:thioester reductase-like protein
MTEPWTADSRSMAEDLRSEAPMGSGGAILLTGATGFLGMEILSRLLERGERHLYALVRARDDAAGTERMRSVIEDLCGDGDAYRDRWTAVAGDIETAGLGLVAARRQELALEVSDVIHCAASVSFSLPLQESRLINVSGTQRLLEFAELCQAEGGLRRFCFISTAYVAGDHSGSFGEDELDLGQGFRNAYERSKFEAEQMVQEFAGRLPVQIFRPSIIVGEQESGWTATFNVLYPPLKAFQAGAYPALPARPSTPVDVVPVDYVADSVFELANDPTQCGEVHHLVAGPRATTVGRLADHASRYFKRRRPLLIPPGVYKHLLHPLLLRLNRGRRRKALVRTETLFPYFTMRVRFDNRRTRARLEKAGIHTPALESYFDRLLRFAVASRWGRNRLSRAQAHQREFHA